MLSSRERVRLAMQHQYPDRVPVMCQLALGHYFLYGSHRPSDVWFDSDALVQTLVDFQQRYRFDGFLINLPGRPAGWKQRLAGYQRGDQGETLTWHSGMVTRVPPDDNAQTALGDGRPLPRADHAKVDPVDPATYRTAGYVWNTWHAPDLWDIPADADLTDPAAYPDWFTRGLRTAREVCPDVSVHSEVFSPFTHLMELFGYQNSLMALIDAPATCHELLAVFSRMVGAQVQCHARCRPDAILISSAFAGAGFISRKMYREFVAPYEGRVVEVIRQFEIPAYTHTCGAIGDRLHLMADTGTDGIDTLDPPPLGTVALAEAKAEFGKRLFLKGNLDAVNEMLLADDATFERAVRERLKTGMPGSGYILSSACSVAPHVQPQRLTTMTALAEQYGRYDADG
jgi:hypothetical protein